MQEMKEMHPKFHTEANFIARTQTLPESTSSRLFVGTDLVAVNSRTITNAPGAQSPVPCVLLVEASTPVPRRESVPRFKCRSEGEQMRTTPNHGNARHSGGFGTNAEMQAENAHTPFTGNPGEIAG